MKILKFLQIFALVCFFYIFAYTTYILLSMAQYVDYYCIPSLLFLIFILYWLIVGVTFPQHLPFFKIQSRLLVAIISIILVFSLCGILIAVETHFYKRPPIQNIMLNSYKIFAIAKQTNPLGQHFKNVS